MVLFEYVVEISAGNGTRILGAPQGYRFKVHATLQISSAKSNSAKISGTDVPSVSVSTVSDELHVQLVR
jgi:uncharacterized protein YegP (UPF0339 family)